MKNRITFISLLLLTLFLALAPNAIASNTWYVDGVHGKNKNDCKSPQHACKTIGQAISLAHSGDSIIVAAATYIENLTIGFSLKIIGSDAKTTIVDGGGVGRVADISGGTSAHVTLSNLTMRNGFFNPTTDCVLGGAGIRSSAVLTINNSTISGNAVRAINRNFKLCGGGILNSGGALTINNSTVSGNVLHTGYGETLGGGIFNSGTLTISNTTVFGNVSDFGGGIFNSGTLTVSNSTLSENFGSGIANHGRGTATLQNTIVANSTSGGNCYGTITSNGYNLSSDNTCNFNNSGDLNNTDPRLGQLGNYGGPTQTIPLLSGSPAIDAGNPSGCTDGNGHLLKTDQRGFPRPDKEDTGGCDMGAYERQN